ncbi:hypothetical protein BH10CHL1_BH10CHL1_06640 [soil metagenome]
MASSSVEAHSTGNNTPVTTRRPKVGVVLGSGGIKAFAALALFEFLDENNIEVDFIAGCSGGALAAAACGAGYTVTQIQALLGEFVNRKLFTNVDYRTFLGMAGLPFGRFGNDSGILKAESIRQVYQGIFKDLQIEDLQPKMVIQATDVLTGDGVVLSQGSVADAVYASSAGFPLLPPIEIDGRWLVDGAFSSSLPVLEAVNRGIDVIIAVAFRQHLNGENPGSFFEHTVSFMGRTTNINEAREMALAIDLHHHEIVLIDVHFDRIIQMWDADAIPIVLEAGRKMLEPKKRAILAAITNFAPAMSR